MTPMLSFENVNVAMAGASAALIGRNGAGKTTTVRTIMGFTEASGIMRLGGEDLGSVPPHRRPALGIGYAPEDRRLFSAFSVEENILLPGRVAKLSGEETRRRLDRAYTVLPELKELARRPAGSVSGGQGKMVALGRALMLGTRLVILDEPFQGLAPALAQRYAEALRRLRSQDKTITLLITESNPKLLDTFADMTLTIERGEIEAGAGT
jgi:branched-chain amino acid transport system ATP-binding protein